MGWTVQEWTRLDEGERLFWTAWYNQKMTKLASEGGAKK